MKLILATANKHKLIEISSIMNSKPVKIISAKEAGWEGEIKEDGLTFEENAIKKARIIAMELREWAMADDSGLEVYSLQMRPGVFSARYAGEPVDYKANNDKLLKELEFCADRRARFCCVIALANPKGRTETVMGICYGNIARESRGNGGFGYDPLFIPEGYSQTFGELSPDIKNKISHRARAIALALKKWEKIFDGTKKSF